MKRAANYLLLSLTCTVGFVACNEPAPHGAKRVEGAQLLQPRAEPAQLDAGRHEASSLGAATRSVLGTPDGGQRASVRPVRMWPYGPPACVQCQQLHCSKYFDADPFASCSDALCRDVIRCELDSDCFTDLGNVPQCYCGAGVDLETCQRPDFVPHGACRELIERGVGSTDKTAVLGRFVDAQHPGGIAGQLATCIADLCAAPCIP